MSGELTVCIAGCGTMGRIHAEGYAKLGDKVRLIFRSASEKRAREFADKYGGEWCTDYSRAIEKADIVDICTTHDLHMPMACEAFAAGKHVLVEKAVARTLEETDKMLAAAEKAGTKFMVCENLAFHPYVLEIDRVLARGGIGEPFLIEMNSFGLWSGLSQGGWRADYEKIGGGVLIDLGSHYVYLARKWCRNLESIFARMSHATFKRRGEDTVVLVANDRDGLTATIHLSWGAPGAPRVPLIVVCGTEAAIISTWEDGLFLETSSNAEEPKRTKLHGGTFMDLWWEAIRTAVCAFVECVEKDMEPPVTGRMARDVMEIIAAAERSAREGVAVKLPLV